MNKKGFTLIELLCVIALLALITTIASVGIMTLSKKSKENLYCAKISLIKSSAKEYALKLEKELNESTNLFEGHKSLSIKVQDLVSSGKLQADKDEIVLNPLDNTSMNDIEFHVFILPFLIIIYLNNNQIDAYIENNNIC